MKLDTSKFKKIECDDNCTTLQHPDGHTIKVAHKGLSPELKKELDGVPMHLAKGGKAKFAQKYDPSINEKAARPSQMSKSTNTMPGSPTMAKDNFTEPDAMGTSMPKGELKSEMSQGQYPDVVVNALGKKAPPFGPLGAEPSQHYPPCINPSCKSYGSSHPNCHCYGGVPEGGHFAKGGDVKEDYVCSTNRKHDNSCQYFKEGGMAEGEAPGAPEEAPTKLPELQSTPGAAQELSGTPPQQTPLQPMQEDPVEQEMAAADHAADQVNPNPEISEAAPATPAPAPDRAPASKIDQFQQHKDSASQELYPEAQAFKADLDNGHITPETYSSLFHDKGTLGKIGTIFGLLLSGGGSAVAGQPNALLHMMDKQIENDLNSQQHSVTNKQNFLKINQQNLMNKAQIGSINADTATKSYALSRVQMNNAALHKLVTDTQKLPNGPQKDQALQTLAMMNQGVQNENFNILDRAASASALAKTLMGDSGGSGQPNTTLMKSGLVGPEAKEMGNDIEEKTISGVPEISGQRASRPIPQASRDQALAMTTLANKAKDLINYSKSHEGSWNPKTRAIAQQKAEEMVGFYGSSLGVSGTQGNRTWLEDQIAKKNPTSIIAQELYGSGSKLKEIADSNDMRKNVLLTSLGFKPAGKKSETSPEKNSVTSKSGREMIQKNGKWVYK